MLAAEERAEVEASGVQSFTLSPEAEAAFVAHARSVHWEKVKADVPDSYDELRAAVPTGMMPHRDGGSDQDL